MKLPKNTVAVSPNGRNWYKPTDYTGVVQYAVDVNDQHYRRRNIKLTLNRDNPNHSFAKVTKQHVDHMAKEGFFK